MWWCWVAVALVAGPVGEPDAPADTISDVGLGVGPQAEWAPAPPVGLRAGLRLAVRGGSGRLRGGERLRLAGLTLHRNWAGSPDSISALGFDFLGPRLPAGICPRVGLARGFLRASSAARAAGITRVARDSWTLGLAAPAAGAALTLRQGVLRGWSAHAGRPGAAAGALRVSSTRSAKGVVSATRFAWRLRRAARLDLSGRLAPREGALRLTVDEGGQRFELALRSTRARRTVRATATRKARPGVPSLARMALRWNVGRWRAGAVAAMRGDSLGLEGFAARGFGLRAGRLELSAGTRLGPVCQVRAHAGFTPRARLGPLGASFGAGAAYRRQAGRERLRAEFSAGLRARVAGVSARVGWEVSPAGLRMDGSPAMAVRLEARPGPLALSTALRPMSSGARWSAALQWSTK
jgi:hypothetical protein